MLEDLSFLQSEHGVSQRYPNKAENDLPVISLFTRRRRASMVIQCSKMTQMSGSVLAVACV